MDLETEPNINWVQDPYGRRGQIQRQFQAAEAKSHEVASALQCKVQAIAQLEDENRRQIKTAAEKAYQAIEGVVKMLLIIESGEQRLSRRDASIVVALQDSVKNFESLCAISSENKNELGIKGGDCKELGDGASRLGRSLGDRAAGLNTDAAAVYTSHKEYIGKWWTHHCEEENLRSRVRDKQSSVDDVGNGILNLFDSGVGDRLRRELSEAQERLNKNLSDQQVAKETSERFYQLAITAKNASAAFMALKTQLIDTSSEFANEYVKVMEAQNVETDLWTGLLDLKDKIWSTDYISTRDKSLRQVLRLLTLDDIVFMRHEFFETTETRIKAAITDVLGTDALGKLTIGKFGLAIEDGELRDE